jgi:hypothetical protein
MTRRAATALVLSLAALPRSTFRGADVAITPGLAGSRAGAVTRRTTRLVRARVASAHVVRARTSRLRMNSPRARPPGSLHGPCIAPRVAVA